MEQASVKAKDPKTGQSFEAIIRLGDMMLVNFPPAEPFLKRAIGKVTGFAKDGTVIKWECTSTEGEKYVVVREYTKKFSLAWEARHEYVNSVRNGLI